jgi:hypothetical protein
MAPNGVALPRHRRFGDKGVHELETRKTKPGVKISLHGVKSGPHGAAKRAVDGVTVHSFDTVRALSAVPTVSIEGTHIIYHRA